MNKPSQLVSALLTLALGILFVILRGQVVGIAILVLGIALIISAIIDFVKKNITAGVIKAVLGIVVLVLGGLLKDIALIILGIVLLLYGVLELVKRLTSKKKKKNATWVRVLGLIEPVLCILVSLALIFRPGQALDIAILIGGIVLIVDGALALIAALGTKK